MRFAQYWLFPFRKLGLKPHRYKHQPIFGSSLIHEIDIVVLRVSASTNMVILISETWFEHRQIMVISISKD
jgi:hypothetical protein